MQPVLIRDFTPKNNKKSGGLFKIIDKSRSINNINNYLVKNLPAQFKTGNLKLINIKKKLAVFGCNSQAVAFRARQQQSLLLKLLKKNSSTKHIATVEVKIV